MTPFLESESIACMYLRSSLEYFQESHNNQPNVTLKNALFVRKQFVIWCVKRHRTHLITVRTNYWDLHFLHHSTWCSTIQIGKYNSQTTVINISGLRDETSAEDRYEGMGRLTQPKEAWSLHKKISIPSSMGNLVAFALNHSNGGTQTRIVTTKSVIQMALYDNFGSFYSNCLQTKYNQIELNKG